MNKFYYSKKQGQIAGYNYVFNGNEWVKYTEWKSKEYSNKPCNWDDAILVYETDSEYPSIKTGNKSNYIPDTISINTLMSFASIVTNKPNTYNNENKLSYNMVDLKSMLDKLLREIDMALVKGDKEEFMRLSKQYNHLKDEC